MNTTKRENKVKQKREKLIEAASMLFSEKNFHEVMMEDVAKAASVAKGTVYNYFESKEELYFSIMQTRMEKLISSLNEKINNEMNSIGGLHSFVIHLYMFMMKYQSFFLIYRRENLKSVNELCSLICKLESELKNILVQIIRKGHDEGLLRDIDEKLAVDLVLGSIYSAVHRGIELQYDEEVKIDERNKLFEYIKNGLFDNNNLFPLKNKTILITRSDSSSEESAELFAQLGADVISFPTISIAPVEDWDEFDKIVSQNHHFEYLIFTSVNAVKIFSERIESLNISVDYSSKIVIAVGKKTASVCAEYKIPVNIIPQEFSASGIIKSIEHFELNNKIVFIPRSAIGRNELPDELEKRGAIVKSVPIYNITLPPQEIIKKNIQLLEEKSVDIFVFTSPSTFINFIEIMNINEPTQFFKGYKVAAIGETTKKAIENQGVSVDIIPSEYTMEGLTKEITNFYKHQK